MSGYHTWADGENLTEDQINDLASYVVPRFATEADRDAAMAPDDGQLCYVIGVGWQRYTGGWEPLLPAAPVTGVAVLVAGTVTVALASVTATSQIMLTVQELGTVTAPAAVAVTARTDGVSFTITSADATDTSTIAWSVIEP